MRMIDPKRIEFIDPAMVRALRGKSSVERIEMVLAANRTMRLLLEGHLRTRHPDWDDASVRREVARRVLRGSR